VEYVLKVNGRFFNHEKIQNKASCLYLLEKYCPASPVPRLVAWSEHGVDVISASADRKMFVTAEILDSTRQPDCPGWILMTRVEGESLSTLSLTESSMQKLGRQLGDLVADWRTAVPTQRLCGNLRFESPAAYPRPADIVLARPGDSGFPELWIRGLLVHGAPRSKPVSSMLEYYTAKLHGQMKKLKEEEVYSPNRNLLSDLKMFVVNTLPRLKVIQQTDAESRGSFVLTHYDLSPRNVLISHDPLRVAGIVDFEFAGFFPHLDEFINDAVGNEGDWPQSAYQAYCDRLAERHIVTPLQLTNQDIWKQAHALGRLQESIAPWWLEAGGTQGASLSSELEKAAAIVRQMLLELESARG
jgi:hypothetical protein